MNLKKSLEAANLTAKREAGGYVMIEGSSILHILDIIYSEKNSGSEN